MLNKIAKNFFKTKKDGWQSLDVYRGHHTVEHTRGPIHRRRDAFLSREVAYQLTRGGIFLCYGRFLLTHLVQGRRPVSTPSTPPRSFRTPNRSSTFVHDTGSKSESRLGFVAESQPLIVGHQQCFIHSGIMNDSDKIKRSC